MVVLVLAVVAVHVFSTPPAAAASEVADPSEIVEMRTATSRTYALADGKRLAVFFTGSVNYRDENGEWQRIENDLVASNRPPYAYANEANRYRLHLPAKLEEAPVRFEFGGEWVTFSLDGATGAASVSGPVATYKNALPGVTLRYSAQSDGVKEDLTLESATAIAPITFSLALSPGLSAKKNAEGGIDFVAEDGKRVFSFAPPFMVDSSGSEAVSTAIETTITEAAGGLVLTLVPDSEWLLDPARVWPVTIDPNVDLAVTQDCHIYSGGPTNSYCGSSYARVGYDANGKRRGLFQFDVGAYKGGTSAITNGDLALDCLGGSTGNNAYIDVHRVYSPWNNKATWNHSGVVDWPNGGDFGGSYVWATRNLDCSVSDVKLWDITGLVQGWVDGTYANNYGLIVKQRGETTTNLLDFASIEHSTRAEPELRVTYNNSAPAVPSSLAPASGTVSTDFTPTLSATYSDSDAGDTGYVRFQVCSDSSCASVVASGDGTTVGSGQTSSWTVPAGVLTGATRYYWRAQAFDGTASSAWSATPYPTYTPNTPPSVPTNLLPASGTESMNTAPTLSATYSDPDAGDSGHVRFQICSDSACGTVVASASGTTVAPGETSSWSSPTLAAGTYYWRAQASDGDFWNQNDVAVWSAAPYPTYRVNRAPSIPTGLAPAEGTASNDETPTLSATYSDPDAGDSGHVRFQVCSDSACATAIAAGDGTTVSPGETSTWTVPSALTSGQTYYWRAQAHDGTTYNAEDPATWTGAISYVLGPPGNTVAPTISGIVGERETLIASTGSWSNTPTRYSYQWQRCNAAGANCADLPGAIADVYTLTRADVAWTIRVRVTATNDAGSGTADSTTTSNVGVGAAMTGLASFKDNVLATTPYSYWGIGETTGAAVDHVASRNGTYLSSAPNELTRGVGGPAISGAWDPGMHIKDEHNLDSGSSPLYSSVEVAPNPPYARPFDFLGRLPFSVNIWINWDGYREWRGYDHHAGIIGTGGWMIDIPGANPSPGAAKLRFRRTTGNAEDDLFARDRLPLRRWAMVTATYDGTTMKLYQDGELVASQDNLYDAQGGSAYLRIGVQDYNASLGGSWGYFNGTLDEPAVWDRALTAAEIDSIYMPPRELSAGSTYGRGDCDPYACNPTGSWAEPVNSATGSYWSTTTDVALPGVGVPFALTRTYNSADFSTGPMGSGWRHNFAASLEVQANGDVLARGADGQQLLFVRQADMSFVAAAAARASLASVSDGYELVQHDQVRLRFDTQGRLTSQRDRNGQGIAIAYGAGGQIATVTDSAGRVITFTHNSAGLLTAVSLPDGRSVGYGYADGRLTTVTDVRGGTSRYEYGASGRLTRAIDARGNTVVENAYAADGRIAEQLDGLGNRTTFAWDAATQTATMTDPAGKVWKDLYFNNVLRQRIDPLGNATSNEYNESLSATKVTDPRGNATTMTYDSRANLLSRKAPAPLSYVESWTYNARNDVTSYTNGRDKTTTYDYDAAGNLIRKTESGSTVTEYGRDAGGKGLLLSLTNPRGKTTTYTYDASNLLTAITSPLGKKTTFGYDAAGRVTSVVEPRGNEVGATAANYTTSYTYDDAGNRLTVTDPLARMTTFTYDANGNLLTLTNARNKTWTYAYNAANERTSETAPDTSTVAVAYDSRGNISRTTSALGHVTTFTYDDSNRMRTRVDPRGNVAGADPALFTWTYGYDANGNRTSVADALGNTTTFAYDELNRMAGETNARNKATTYAYDANGNVTGVTDAKGNTRSFTFDALDRLTAAADGRGKVTSYAYDGAGNRTSATTPLGNTTTFTYDDDNRLSAVVEPRGNVVGASPSDYTTTYGYDAASHLVTLTNPLGELTSYAYDRAGRLTSRTDANNHTLSWTYDELGRLTKTTAPDLSETIYVYDDVGNLTSRTDAKNHATTYAYDADRRLTSVTNALGKRWTFEYDASGNLAKRVDAKANAANDGALGTTAYSYDRVNRVTGIDYSDTTPDVAFTYDAIGNRVSMTDGAGSETYSWDDADNLSSVTRGTDSFSYAYDAADNVTQRTYPDATAVSYAYDDDGRLASVASGGATTSYGYDAAANLTTTTLPASNGYVETRSYDRAGRLSDITNASGATTLSRFTITRDSVGNPTRIVTNAGTETYAYDALDRATEACYQLSCAGASDPYIRWTYDAVGNRTSESRPAGTTTYTYDAADQLTERSGLGGTVSYAYDDNGNQTAGGSRTFAWDMAGRMTSTTSSGATTSYSYDGDGKRLQASSGTGTTKYLWDRNALLPQLALERDAQDALLRRYVFGHDTVSMTTSGAPFYYHYDGIGSVANVTDAAGAPQWTYAYEPFGAARQETQDATSAPANPLRFTGEYLDSAAALYHLRAREYDPTAGRFLATDPLAPAIADPYVGAYVYVNQRPTVLVDPSGLCGWSDLGGCASSAGDIAAGAGELFTGAGAALGTSAADAYSARGGGVNGTLAAIDAFNPIANMWEASTHAYAREGGGWRGVVAGFNEGFNPAYALLVAGDGCVRAIAAGDERLGGRMCAKALVEAAGVAGAGRIIAGFRHPAVGGGARFIVGSDGVVTDVVGSRNAISLGRYPAYLRDAQASGSRAFHIGDEWEAMVARTDRFGGTGEGSEVWIRNQRFLDRAIAQRSEIRLASDPFDFRNAESFFEREISYLMSRGYEIKGNRMVRAD